MAQKRPVGCLSFGSSIGGIARERGVVVAFFERARVCFTLFIDFRQGYFYTWTSKNEFV